MKFQFLCSELCGQAKHVVLAFVQVQRGQKLISDQKRRHEDPTHVDTSICEMQELYNKHREPTLRNMSSYGSDRQQKLVALKSKDLWMLSL
jgi:hypothetical protein